MESPALNGRPALAHGERGTALLLAIVLTTVLSAAAAAAALTARVETLVAGNHARATEALYVAQGGLTRAVQALAQMPDWSVALAGGGALIQEPVASWLPPGAIESRFSVTVSTADDAADNDGDPRADSNGVVVVHSLALGPGGARRAVRGIVQRGRPRDGAVEPAGARLLSVQETR